MVAFLIATAPVVEAPAARGRRDRRKRGARGGTGKSKGNDVLLHDELSEQEKLALTSIMNKNDGVRVLGSSELEKRFEIYEY